MASQISLWKNRRVQLFDYFVSVKKEQVIELHEKEGVSFSQILPICPTLPKGWFELAMLTIEDRKEFFSAYWKSCFSYQPMIPERIDHFFSSLEEIGIYLVRSSKEEFYEPHLCYHGKDEHLFIGHLPATLTQIMDAQKNFEGLIDPQFLNFCQIHNGMNKISYGRIFALEKMALEVKRDRYTHSDLLSFYRSEKDENHYFALSEEERIVYSQRSEEEQLVCLTDSWVSWLNLFLGSHDVQYSND